MKDSAASNLLNYLINNDGTKKSTENLINSWAAGQDFTLNIREYLEAREMVRLYKHKKSPCEMMRFCAACIGGARYA